MQFLDILWFLFWFTLGGALITAVCSDEKKQKDCKGAKDLFGLWILVNLIIWLSHFVTAGLLCCWGCQGSNIEAAREREKKEAMAKADAEAAERRAN